MVGVFVRPPGVFVGKGVTANVGHGRKQPSGGQGLGVRVGHPAGGQGVNVGGGVGVIVEVAVEVRVNVGTILI